MNKFSNANRHKNRSSNGILSVRIKSRKELLLDISDIFRRTVMKKLNCLGLRFNGTFFEAQKF